ncbi:MAG: HAMP domain-containing protein [Gemmatimonadetes bacterium]|nr:HAMP domain-containing protein [Gemmatimonadota bacterium]MBT7861698.1 HAMP domain-containing protein [Gemmatimonadota bacterium]
MRLSLPGQGRHGTLSRRLVLSFVTVSMVVLGSSGWMLYRQALDSLEDQLATHLMAETELVASRLSGEIPVLIRLRPGYETGFAYRGAMSRLTRDLHALGARRIYVFDTQGRGLLDTRPGARIGRDVHEVLRNRFHREKALQAFSGQVVHTRRFIDEQTGDHHMTGYAPIVSPRTGDVIAGVGVDIGASYMAAILSFKRSVFLFAALGALLTLLVGVGMARHITRPVQRLVMAAREIGRGNLERAVEIEATDEIGLLGETMEEMRQKVLARDAQLRQMLGGVAHEIRNPLSGIEIYAGLIAEDLPEDDARRAHIQKVIGEVRNLSNVISEFLDFARPSPPQMDVVDVSRLVEEAAFLLSPEMETAGVVYEQDLDRDLEARGDAEQIKRAVINLMKNAVQSMGKMEGHLRATTQLAGDLAVIQIADDGPGIPASVRQHLFEPFFTTRQKGSGLGLAIVQQTAEKNGGRVEVESVEGQGAIFRLLLPLAPVGVPQEVDA